MYSYLLYIGTGPQSIQNARLSLWSSEMAPPTPSPASECCPPPFSFGVDTLAGEEVGGANSEDGRDTQVF
jgi:hypothetical protein